MQLKTSPLRERRRRQTAREIQHVTLQLIRSHGYGSVTTEMIAKEAGISLRTFFKYYANKEAAAVGPPVLLDEDALGIFAHAKGPLTEDFATLIQNATRIQSARKDTIRTIDEVARAVPELEVAFTRSLSALETQLLEALQLRFGIHEGMPEENVARLLARVMAHALALAFREWGHSDAMQLDDAIARITESLNAVAQHLNTE